MIRDWLYAKEGETLRCKLCNELDEQHQEGCPGEWLESVQHRLTYRAPNCGCGCSGYTEGEVEGESLEACLAAAARELRGGRALLGYSLRATHSLASDRGSVSDLLSQRVKQLRQRAEQEAQERARVAEEARQQEREREQAEERARAREALEQERALYTPEGYAQKLKELDA